MILDKVAKLGKAAWDSFNLGGWLICKPFRKIGLPNVSIPRLTTLTHCILYYLTPLPFQTKNGHIHVFSLLIYNCQNICEKSEFVDSELVVGSGEQNTFCALYQPTNK